MKLEEEHENIFLSIESAVISCAKVNPAIRDADVLRAYESLANAFTRKKKGLPDLPFMVPTKAKFMCETVFPLATLYTDGGEIEGEEVEAMINHGVMIKIFNRLIQSVRMWTKKDGPMGYLTFVSRFVG